MEKFVKLIPRKTIEEMIAYRDGKVELTNEIIGEVDNFSDFVVCNNMELQDCHMNMERAFTIRMIKNINIQFHIQMHIVRYIIIH